MKLSDIGRVQQLSQEKDYCQSVLGLIASGEPIKLSIGDMGVELTESMKRELKLRIATSLEKQLEDISRDFQLLNVEE